MNKFVASLMAAMAGGIAIVAGFTLDQPADARSASSVLGPGRVRVELDIDYSAYSTAAIEVYEGTLVEFVVRNHDPINHELVVGGPEVHARHRIGNEAAHPPIPGELSLAPDAVGLTIFRFDEPGVVEFACHLQGHYDYGMRGMIEVLPIPIAR